MLRVISKSRLNTSQNVSDPATNPGNDTETFRKPRYHFAVQAKPAKLFASIFGVFPIVGVNG
jgi:hypothetical protein